MKIPCDGTWLTLWLNKFLLMTIVVVILVVSSVAQTAQAQESPTTSAATHLSDWKRYTVKDEEFSVLLPVMPAMNTGGSHVEKLNKDRKERMLGAYADGVVYAIHTFENPKRRQSLDEVITEFYGKSEDRTPHDLRLGGFSGKEYAFQEAEMKGVSRFYITDHYIYLFRAVGSKLGNPDVAIPKFFSSIRLGIGLEGTEVVDGPGEQSISNPSELNENNQATPIKGRDLTRKASVYTKPEPSYTEIARKNGVTGAVVLRCVFSSSGAVTGLRVISGLPYGLTDKAIAAARQIRFIPAIKDGRFVSMYVQLEYNFNLY
jgi:TonB family protein